MCYMRPHPHMASRRGLQNATSMAGMQQTCLVKSYTCEHTAFSRWILSAPEFMTKTILQVSRAQAQRGLSPWI